MAHYLSADIWCEILLKLPVEFLIRLTTVCKSWKSLIMSPDFIYAHLSVSKNHSVLRSYDEHDKDDSYLPLDFIKTGRNESFQISDYSNSKLPFKHGHYKIVGSCDGIVCLTNDFLFNSSPPVILWNPSVRSHMYLPQPITNRKRPRRVLLGFGAANHVYKVIRLAYRYNYPECVFGVQPRAEIFSLGTKGWRRVLGFDIKLRVPSCMWRQVLLKGIVHWLGYEPIDDISHRSSILAFDMGDEVFSEVMLPDVLAKKNVESLCLHKIRGSLVVMNSSPFFFADTDVWVMKEYVVKASWTKLYNIDLAEECKNNFRMIGFKNGEALLNYNGPNLVFYNLETKQLKDLETCGTPRSFYIDDYVESLLLLKGNNVPVVGEIGEA